MKKLYYFIILILGILSLLYLSYCISVSSFLESNRLFDAVTSNNIEQVERLLKNGCNPNIMEDKYETALIQAIDNNYLDIVILLLEHGADPNQTNSIGSTPLIRAIFSNNQHKFVPLVLMAGANINKSEAELNQLEGDGKEYAQEIIQYYQEAIKNIGATSKS